MAFILTTYKFYISHPRAALSTHALVVVKLDPRLIASRQQFSFPFHHQQHQLWLTDVEVATQPIVESPIRSAPRIFVEYRARLCRRLGFGGAEEAAFAARPTAYQPSVIVEIKLYRRLILIAGLRALRMSSGGKLFGLIAGWTVKQV